MRPVMHTLTVHQVARQFVPALALALSDELDYPADELARELVELPVTTIAHPMALARKFEDSAGGPNTALRIRDVARAVSPIIADMRRLARSHAALPLDGLPPCPRYCAAGFALDGGAA